MSSVVWKPAELVPLTAVHLLQSSVPFDVVLVERTGRFACGLAYGVIPGMAARGT